MPLYEFICNNCKQKFEIIQKLKEDPIKKCPNCKKLKLNRVFSSMALLVFKGSGFYETDYKFKPTNLQ